MASCRTAQVARLLAHVHGDLAVPRLGLRIRRRGAALGEGLLEVVADVVEMLGADRDADQVLGDAAVDLLLVAQLLVGGGPGVNGEGLAIANATQPVSTKLQPRVGAARGVYLARLEIISKPSTTWLPAAPPPLTPNDSTPPEPRGRYFLASACDG